MTSSSSFITLNATWQWSSRLDIWLPTTSSACLFYFVFSLFKMLLGPSWTQVFYTDGFDGRSAKGNEAADRWPSLDDGRIGETRRKKKKKNFVLLSNEIKYTPRDHSLFNDSSFFSFPFGDCTRVAYPIGWPLPGRSFWLFKWSIKRQQLLEKKPLAQLLVMDSF